MYPIVLPLQSFLSTICVFYKYFLSGYSVLHTEDTKLRKKASIYSHWNSLDAGDDGDEDDDGGEDDDDGEDIYRSHLSACRVPGIMPNTL